jgi:hypothetical protein
MEGVAMTIVPFLRDNVFEPPDIYAMSTALHDVCLILNITDGADSEKRLLATEIIAFVHQGPREAALLRDQTAS